MAGYFTTSRKRKAQGAKYGTGDYASDASVQWALLAGPGYTGVQPTVIGQHRLRQTTTSFRSNRDGSGEINPSALIYKNQQENLKNSTFDNGHPFETRDERIYFTHPRVTLRGDNGAFYQGPLYVDTTGGGDLNWPPLYPDFLDWSIIGFSPDDLTYGTRAMAKTAPDQSPTNLLRALGELKQDLPRVPLAALDKLFKLQSPRHARLVEEGQLPITDRSITGIVGDETLNFLFGVQPTVQDAMSLLQAVIHAGKLIEQWQRDAGRVVRRSLDYDPITTTLDSRSGQSRAFRTFGTCFGTINFTSWMDSMIRDHNELLLVSREQTVTDKYRFVGAFTYYIDPLLQELGPAGSAFQIAQHLLGLSFDANTLWQLTPWTWLVDWLANLGDCISLMSRINDKSLVLRYGYLMRESVMKTSLTVDHFRDNAGTVYRDIRTDGVITRKVRIRSTPYGFGLSEQAFSPIQWAILASLGMTSGEHQLRYL